MLIYTPDHSYIYIYLPLLARLRISLNKRLPFKRQGLTPKLHRVVRL